MCSTPRADRHVVDAGGDQRRGEVDGLLGRPALAVERRGRGLDRQPGLQPGVAADVEALLAELLDAAGDDVLDLGGRDAGALDDLAVALRQQVAGVGVLVVALLLVATADRGPDRLDDHDLAALLGAHGLESLRLIGLYVLGYLTDWPISQDGGDVRESLGIAGSGTIACGLAASAAQHGDVVMWVRSEDSARRAEASLEKAFGRLEDEVDPSQVRLVTDPPSWHPRAARSWSRPSPRTPTRRR